jgi:hypothetical protein
MDYQDFLQRKLMKSNVAPDVPRALEWVWQGSATFGPQVQVRMARGCQWFSWPVWQLP